MELLVATGRILLGPPGAVIDEGAVLVRDDTIVAVGAHAEVASQAGDDASRLSFADGTLLPGLVNAHVHVAFDGSRDLAAAVQQTDDLDLLLGMAGRARLLLEAGVTTARDLGDRRGLSLRLRDAIAAGRVPGPRLLCAAAPLTPPGGHCWFLGGEVDGDDAIRELVRSNAAAGADVIKVMVSGGQMTPGGAAMWESQFDARQLGIVVTEARRAGLRVAAHSHGTDGIAAAVAAGVDTIEHCTWLDEGQFAPDAAVTAEMAAKGIIVCPTTSANWQALAKYVGEERASQLQGRVRWLHDRGVTLALGTDAGLPGSAFDDFVGSFGLYEQLGFSAAEIIEMATVNGATALGLADTTGQIAAGMSADLLVVDGDPLADLAALRSRRLVVAAGRPYSPSLV